MIFNGTGSGFHKETLRIFVWEGVREFPDGGLDSSVLPPKGKPEQRTQTEIHQCFLKKYRPEAYTSFRAIDFKRAAFSYTL